MNHQKQTGSDPADTLSPFRQAQVVLDHLSPGQVAAYCRSSGLRESTSREYAALHFAEHRVTALQEAALTRERLEQDTRKQQASRDSASWATAAELPERATQELAEATAVRDQGARTWALVTKALLRTGFATGVAFLALGLLGMLLPPLLGVAGVCLAVSFLCLFVLSSATEAAGYRRSREALLDWAVERPGQLERGLPSLGVRAESRAAELLGGCLTIAAGAIAMFCAPMVVVLFLVALLDQRATTWQITGTTAAIGLLAFLAPRVIEARTFWIGRSTRTVDESLAWVHAAGIAEQVRA